MSNNFHPHQLSESNNEMQQMEPFFQELSSISDLGMGPTVPMSTNYAMQHLVTSDKQLENTISYNPTSYGMPLSKQMANQQMEALPSKHGASAELNNYVPPQLSIPHNRLEQMDSMLNSPRWVQQSTPIKRKYVQMQSTPVTPGSQNVPPVNKKMVRIESMPGRSGSQHTPRGRNAQNVPFSKSQTTESFESVRSKMRETLAAALAFVPPNQDKTSNEEKVSQNQDKTSNEEKVSQGESVTNSMQTQEVPRHAESASISVSTEKCSRLEFAQSTVSRVDDVTFSDNMFVKDELLQGNGLLWAMELDADVVGPNEIQTTEKPKLEHESVQSPESLASKIEAELFKLFGGVNKKYKEKGRSLTFNLKDRSNPALRERVISGEISPERLCSMTAEELASEELSQWRMAKAEELAQMIVLPDSDVNMRRLVKKTHKGEFQVEVDQDDGVSVEVSVGTTLLTRLPAKKKEMEGKENVQDRKENLEDEKSTVGNEDLSNSLTIPSDGADLMQGLMVDDFKDEDYLPPIVSLDEFMESLDTEPPFENLPVDAPLAERVNPEATRGFVTNSPASKDPVVTAPVKAERNENAQKLDLKENNPSRRLVEEPKPSPLGDESGAIWEGVLQLNISSMVTAVGLFKSGDKASTKEWSSSLEIKGRVRLDAFEKFLQELPMSRSRAVMITQFILKEGSSENDRANLCEAVDSYVLDERLGFAEPAPGVEIYFCPPRGGSKIIEMLGKHLSKEYPEILKSVDSGGLIGVVVWRKPHLISPNSSSHNKHSSKKQHFRRRQQQQQQQNITTNTVASVSYHRRPNNNNTQSPPVNDDNDDDDIPPGFGPGAGRDDDDLPEFNFSRGGGSNPQPPVSKFPSSSSSRFGSVNPRNPGNHVRDLIHKYGQTESDENSVRNTCGDKAGSGVVAGIGIKPWVDEDDDDDIPEWDPQKQPPPPPRTQQQYNQNNNNNNSNDNRYMQQPQQPVVMAPVMNHQMVMGHQQQVPLGMHQVQPPNAVVMPGGGMWYGQPNMVLPGGGGGLQYYNGLGLGLGLPMPLAPPPPLPSLGYGHPRGMQRPPHDVHRRGF